MKKPKPKSKEKEHNPNKYIDLNPYDSPSDIVISEGKTDTAVITFGRFNPMHTGHEKLVNKILEIARKEKATAKIYMSHTQDKKKNPLSYDDKLHYAKIAFGSIVTESNAKTIIQVAKELQNEFKNLIVVVGKDRISEFETLLSKYNGKEFQFDEINVVSGGDRDPDSDDITGMSASKMRSFAQLGNFEMFKKGLPTKLKSHAEYIYKAVREGSGLMEDLEEERKPLTISQRRRRAMTMRRYKTKLKMGREKAERRMASADKLKLRAQRKARGIIRDRLMKNKKYSEMKPAEKIELDKRLMRIPKVTIDRIAKRQLPIVRKAEIQRLSDRRNPTTEETDLNMIFEQFLDEAKKFRYLFTKEGKVNYDKRFKMFKPKAKLDEAELFDLIDSLDEGAAVERVRATIEMEKTADKNKHKRMLDRAREIDKVRFEGVDKTKPSNREHGTDSLVRILKKDTPGENLKETEKEVQNDSLQELDHMFDQFLEATKSRGFEGKTISVKNKPVRMIDGSMRSLPPGKSSSSKGGNGD